MPNPDKHLLGYPNFKDAKRAAVEYATQYKNWTKIMPIYQERDGSFTLRPTDGKTKFVVAVDKSGQEYDLVKTTAPSGATNFSYEKRIKNNGVQK